MPIYVYKTSGTGCEHCREGFEELQSLKAAPLRTCPRCGGPVKRVPGRVHGGVPTLSDGNLRDHGFTKLVNKGDGTFEKTT